MKKDYSKSSNNINKSEENKLNYESQFMPQKNNKEDKHDDVKLSESLYSKSRNMEENNTKKDRRYFSATDNDILIKHRKKRFRKRVLSIALTIFFVALIAFGAWYIYFNKDAIIKYYKSKNALEDSTKKSSSTESTNSKTNENSPAKSENSNKEITESESSSSHKEVEVTINPSWENRE